MKKTIVTILSTNYAGSHFLSLLMGSHSQACHIGEVRRVVRGHGPGGEVGQCDLCNPPSQCPTVRNLVGIDIKTVYDRVFDNFAEEGLNPPILIDTSKRVDWARENLSSTLYDFKYIHLIRDPRAFIRRYILNNKSLKCQLHIRRQAAFRGEKWRPSHLFSPQWKVCLGRWYDKNAEIADFLRNNNCDHQVVTYRDLATDTAGELSRITSWLGLQFEPKQVEYWTFQHHGSQKFSYEWIKQQRKTGHLDVRWKEFLSPDTATAVARDPDVVGLLDRLSLSLDDMGLTRNERQIAAFKSRSTMPISKSA